MYVYKDIFIKTTCTLAFMSRHSLTFYNHVNNNVACISKIKKNFLCVRKLITGMLNFPVIVLWA